VSAGECSLELSTGPASPLWGVNHNGGRNMRHVPEGSDTAPGDATLRVIVADDDPLTRRVVRDALEAGGVIVIAEAASGREAVELSLHYKPDVVLMDLVMPNGDGIQATRRILASEPATNVVMLTSSDDDEVGIVALREGASGFLNKGAGVDALPRALRAAAAGEAVVSRRLTMRLVESLRRTRPDGAGVRPVRSRLTQREWEVLDLLCAGQSTDEIANTLVLSSETVRSHIKNLLRKLGVSSRQAAIEEARRMRADLAVADESAGHGHAAAT
jgi:two-component system, NarL family, response regulator LiaR